MGQNEQGASTFPVIIRVILCIWLYATKYLSPVNKFHGGVEGWCTMQVGDYITSQRLYDDKEHWRSVAIQTVIGNEFLFGHFSMLVNGGVYVYNPAYHKRLKTEDNSNLKKEIKGWITVTILHQRCCCTYRFQFLRWCLH
ncbi:MAG: hypothetical protein R2847_10035 [Bacteroidia bacterium]